MNAIHNTIMSGQDRWERVISCMVLEDVVVHEILLLLEKRANNAVETIGVSIQNSKIVLFYNEGFVAQLSDPELRYVLTHEVYHLILHHCTIRRNWVPTETLKWNVAADLAVNSLIPLTKDRYPPRNEYGEFIGCFPDDFDFEPKLSMEQYVHAINKKMITLDAGIKTFDNHAGWQFSEIIDELLHDVVGNLQRKGTDWGRTPDDIQKVILAAQKPQVKWTTILRTTLGHLSSRERVASLKKPNRRYPYPYCGSVPKSVEKRLVAIDTSASIGTEMLEQFLCEINRLAELQQVDIVLFDCEITRQPRPFDRKEKKFTFYGGGGTNFTPLMNLAEERRYSSLIIFTDGLADETHKPKNVDEIIWVIVGGGTPPVAWGKRIYVTATNPFFKTLF